jgi:hypothetical protein
MAYARRLDGHRRLHRTLEALVAESSTEITSQLF